MKTRILFSAIALIISLPTFSIAKGTKVQKVDTKLSTDHAFSGLNVNGRYQSAHEGLATVENEKPILDILDYPSSYEDRIKTSKEWVR